MNLENILNLIYTQAAKRIKTAFENSPLTQSEIYPPDPKQISWIINNNRTKNNRFLICDRVLQATVKNEATGEYKEVGIVPKLEFKNIKETLWGTEQEIWSYLPNLLEAILNELGSDNNYDIDRDLILSDYVPFAKYNTYYKILEFNQYIPAILYGIKEDDVFNNIDLVQKKAFELLFYKCKYEFCEIFLEFTDETTSFHKIDSVFKTNFLEKRFIPMIRKFNPDETSLGIRMKNIIQNDLSDIPKMILNYHQGQSIPNYKKQLISASSKYAVELEKIQVDQYPFLK